MSSQQIVPDCPHCSTALLGVTTTGPSDHRAQPCGCRVTHAQLPDQ